VVHEDVPKLQRGLDIPRPRGHRRQPFEKGGCVTSIRQGANNGTVGICCYDMTKNWRHIVEQVYDEKDVVYFGRSGEDIERVVQVHSCEQATNVIG
jgi:hypothetical protein